MIWSKDWKLKVDDNLLLDWVRESDVHGPWLSWLQNPKVVEWLEGPRLKKYQLPDLEKYFQQNGRVNNSQLDFKLIAIRYQQKHIGNITLSDWNDLHKHTTLGIVIGDPGYWGKGIAQKVLQELSQFLLDPNKCDLIRLQAGAFTENQGSVKAFLRAGFIQEGLFKNARCFDGKFYDLMWMAKLR
tara:strand:+ start:553 stop:1107 length:555 start_codon:yes stop_codon:yes gene_type:complete